MPIKQLNKVALIIILGTSATANIANAQDAQAQGTQGTQSNTGQYQLGGFLGFTDRRDEDVTLGGEIEYMRNDRWSYGAILEYTPDVYRDEDATVVLATANFRPNPQGRWKLTGGAGMEFKNYAEDDFRLRLGTSFDLFLEGSLTLSPRIAFDFGEGDENIVVGATVSRKF